MAERIDWLPDGTPYSPRFGDRYQSEAGRTLAQAREVFLAGCGLPAAWAGAAQWCILETGFGLGLNFLVAWEAWRSDPARPRLLHYVATEAYPAAADDLRRAAQVHPHLACLAGLLADAWWGLLPGHHRLAFEGGQVLLTLLVGDSPRMLREQPLAADSVFLDGFSPGRNPEMWNTDAMKAVARCARPGTRVATWTIARGVRDALTQAGFVVERVPGVPPKRDNLQARYDPPWTPRPPRAGQGLPRFGPATPGRCVVVGAGIAGAAAAHSLARRGWRVTVLDAAGPAAGASSLPAGLFAPHVSPDDAPLSRLSRAGVRAVLATCAALLQPGTDWGPEGVLEHRVDAGPGLPAPAEGEKEGSGAAGEARHQWSAPADTAHRDAAGLPPGSHAVWHLRGGWLRPARLVAALLAAPGITVHSGVRVGRVGQVGGTDTGTAGRCAVWGVDGSLVAEAPLVVVACGFESGLLLGDGLALQAVAGQMSLAPRPAEADGAGEPGGGFPPFPVNGHGSFLPAVPLEAGPAHWLAGASFERDAPGPETGPDGVAAAHAENRGRLHRLLPEAARATAPAWTGTDLRAWRGVRGAVPDRLPVVGPWPLPPETGAAGGGPAAGTQDAPPSPPPLWVSTAMGSRGLTLALLCGELLAARLHGEPLPVEQRLALAVSAERLARRRGPVKPDPV
ncbi:MAG: FAD-dependent 5-carboxymethylaminomethyl-2-thiouridine(34) oxidoreductase MnmC [Pseudomonadota bacterium]